MTRAGLPFGFSGRNPLLPILTVIMLVVMAGEAMLTAALPEISAEFEIPGVFESWILPMVLLVGAAASPFIGTAGDRYGRKKLLVIALLIYLCGLVSGYYAGNIWQLLISRAMQGIGVASFPLAYALVRDQLSHRDADIGIGVISATYGAGMFLGVIIGSFIIESWSWRLTYLVLIPFSILLVPLTIYGIHDSVRFSQKPASPCGRLDWIGFLSLLAALILGLSAVSLGSDGENALTLRVICIAGALCATVLFIREELTNPFPLIDIRLVRQPPVMLLIAIGFLTILIFMMLLQEMPFLIRSPMGLGLEAGFVGLILMPGTLCDMLAGPLTGRMIISRGVRPACILGSTLLLAAALILCIGQHSLSLVMIAWMVFSAGMSVSATACLIAIIDYVPLNRTAEATGFMQSVQTVGGMFGPVIAGLVFSGSSVTSILDGEIWSVPLPETFMSIHAIALVTALVILACSLLFKAVTRERISPVE